MDRLLNLIYPPRCMACGDYLIATETSVCDACAHTVHLIGDACCVRCALPAEKETGAGECGQCRREAPAFAKLHAIWVYEGAVSEAIRRTKASGDLSSLNRLIELGASTLQQLVEVYVDWEWTTPPPHPADLRRRGWDPARAALRGAFPVVRVRDPVTRVRRTRKQARLSANERRFELIGAFASEPVVGNWVVFDDVVTTGATVGAVARALVRAGADRVHVVALARGA